MNRRGVRILLSIAALSVVLHAAVICSLDLMNTHWADYADLSSGTIDAAAIPRDSPLIFSLSGQPADRNCFRIITEPSERLALIYEDVHAPYRLSIQGETMGQNLLPHGPAYREEMGYSFYQVESPGTGDAALQLCLERKVLPVKPSVQALFYLGTPKVITDMIRLRSMYASALFVCFLIILFISTVAYLRYRADHMLIMVLISLVSVFKSIIAGDLPHLSALMGVTLGNMLFWDSLTGVLNFLLSQLLCYRLFRFRVQKRWLYLYIAVFFLVQTGYLLTHYLPLMVGMHLLGILLILYMGSSAYSRDVPYSILLMSTYSIFSATVIYRFLITFGVFSRGAFSEMFFSPQIGNLLYLSAFLFSVLMLYWARLNELERQQKLLDRITLLRGLNHDLKLPLSVIKLNAQMLNAYEASREEALEYSETILEAAAELEGLTGHIHGFLTSGEPTDTAYETQLQQRLEHLKQQYLQRSVLQGITFTVTGPSEDVYVAASPQQVDRMLHNLIDNAFKYTRGPGIVSLTCTADRSSIQITVEDDGIGMSPQETSRACEPLYRAHSSRNREGAGLGHSVVSSVIESMKGTLQITSTPGVGTKISITLPRKT
ncbi:MAG: hypothetical protein K9L73_01185 [Spirochaetia bacterium]|nr:hypothetical protein [Spirochaetia bacterium]